MREIIKMMNVLIWVSIGLVLVRFPLLILRIERLELRVFEGKCASDMRIVVIMSVIVEKQGIHFAFTIVFWLLAVIVIYFLILLKKQNQYVVKLCKSKFTIKVAKSAFFFSIQKK
jgi:hypothetical protein